MTEETQAPAETTVTITLKPGENFFVLYGSDRFAPKPIDLWADLVRAYARTLPKEQEEEALNLLRKASSAEEEAWKMIAYRKGHVDQVEAPQRETYSGAIGDESKVRVAELTEVVTRIYNSLAELTSAADRLKTLQVYPEVEAEIRETVLPALDKASGVVEPRRYMRQRRGQADG